MYFHLKKLLLCDTKKDYHERNKRFRNKSFNKGDCIQTVSDKRLQHGPPKGYREKP